MEANCQPSSCSRTSGTLSGIDACLWATPKGIQVRALTHAGFLPTTQYLRTAKLWPRPTPPPLPPLLHESRVTHQLIPSVFSPILAGPDSHRSHLRRQPTTHHRHPVPRSFPMQDGPLRRQFHAIALTACCPPVLPHSSLSLTALV